MKEGKFAHRMPVVETPEDEGHGIVAKGEPYIGHGEQDWFIQWGLGGKGRSFATEDDNGLTFKFKIRNTTGEPQKMAILPAFFNTQRVKITQDGSQVITGVETLYDSIAELQKVDPDITCVLAAGKVISISGTEYLEVTEGKRSIRQMQEYVKKYPTRVYKTSVTASDPDVFNTEMSIKECSPFRTEREIDVINFFDHYSVNQQSQNKVDVMRDFQLDATKLIVLDIPDESNGTDDVQMGITFHIGAIHSDARALEEKASEAYEFLNKQ